MRPATLIQVRMKAAPTVLALGVLAAACGGGRVHGEYIGKKGESFFDSLTFRSDGKVEVVLIGVRHEGSFDVSYVVDGNRITVNLPGNEPLLLTRAGSDLAGTMNGETVRFEKR